MTTASTASRMEIWLDEREYTNQDIHEKIQPDFCFRQEDVHNNKILRQGMVYCKMIDASTSQGQDEGLAAVGSVGWILADASLSSSREDQDEEDDEGSSSSWKMIPAENLIAAARNGGTKIAFTVTKAHDVTGLARALEWGVDALCITARDACHDDNLVHALLAARMERSQQQDQHEYQQQGGQLFQHEGGEEESTSSLVVRRRSKGASSTNDKAQIRVGQCYRVPQKAASVVADRVCVDFVQMIRAEEGCFVGSSAKLMALVLSEAAPSSLVPSRPFRINAGPVHSYILMGDGVTTKYLCELQAGDEIAIYNSQTGQFRAVAVGRLKVEVRPCLMVGLLLPCSETGGTEESQLFLQQAETVRLGNKDGAFVRVTDLETDDAKVDLLLRSTSSGTHIGMAYDGKVVEK